MAYDHEEQEQLATLQEWWKKNGNVMTWVLIAALAAYAGWTGWKYYQNNQAVQASQLYDELGKAVTAKDNVKVLRAATDMEQKFGGTTYAQMAALAAAKATFDANDQTNTKAQLQWVIDHGRDLEYKTLAKIRLAGVLLDEKAYDKGLEVLGGDVAPEFDSALADRKGDILVAQNKIDEARAAYQLALDKADPSNPSRQLIQIKLDAIGGSATKAAA